METLAARNITPYLELDEKLLWAGQPKRGLVFEVSDIFKSVLVLVFAAFTYFITSELANISLLLAIPVGVIFFSAWFFLGIGRFFVDAELRKKTFYGMTSKRILIKTSNAKVQSVYFANKPKIDFVPNLDGTATIDLNLKTPSIPGGGGLSWIPNQKASSSLYKLSDANIVHQKIKEITVGA
jgi:hypothetical protein